MRVLALPFSPPGQIARAIAARRRQGRHDEAAQMLPALYEACARAARRPEVVGEILHGVTRALERRQ